RQARTRAVVFAPASTSEVKLERMRHAGAVVAVVSDGYLECERAARQYAAEMDHIFVHSFDDPIVIEVHRSLFRAGQSARASLPDVAFVPVGGGGLMEAAIRGWGRAGGSLIEVVSGREDAERARF